MNRPKKLIAGAATSLGIVAVLEGACHLLPAQVRGAESTASATAPTGPDWAPTPGGLAVSRLGTTTSVPGWDLQAAGATALGLPGSEVDAFHMRSPGYPAEKGDAVRLVFAGDSCSFGYRLDWDDTFAARLARLRQARFPGTEYQAAACAVPGHSSLQTRTKLEDACMAFEPDVVFISSQFNDAALSDVTDAVRFKVSGAQRLLATLRRSALFSTVSTLLDDDAEPAAASGGSCVSGWLPPGKDLCPDVVKDVNRVSRRDYEANLRAMIAVARSGGARPVLILLPHRADWESGTEYPFHAYRETMRSVAADEGVALVDGPAAMFESGRIPEDLFIDKLHPNPRGAKVLALAIDRALGSEPP